MYQNGFVLLQKNKNIRKLRFPSSPLRIHFMKLLPRDKLLKLAKASRECYSDGTIVISDTYFRFLYLIQVWYMAADVENVYELNWCSDWIIKAWGHKL